MSYPETTYAAAFALLQTPAFEPFYHEGRVLTARIVEDGVTPTAKQVNGKWGWVDVPGFKVVFEGGKWGSHELRLSVSSVERIAAHWDGYKVAHTQDAERREAATALPAGARYAPKAWKPAVGDKVYFPRGMFGRWKGTIRKLYTSPGFKYGWHKGEPMAEVSFTRKNGTGGRRTAFVSSLTLLVPYGQSPVVEKVTP